MGSISGDYLLKRNEETVEIEMNMSDGWSSVPGSLPPWPGLFRKLRNYSATLR